MNRLLHRKPNWESDKIPGTSLVCTGPDEYGKYKMKKIIGAPGSIDKIPIGIRMAVNSPGIQDTPLELDMVKTFQRSGDIESITFERDSNSQSNIF